MNQSALKFPHSRDDRETRLPLPGEDIRAFARAAVLNVCLLALPAAYLTWLLGTSLALMGSSVWPGLSTFWADWSGVLVVIAALTFPVLALLGELRATQARRRRSSRTA